MAFVSLLLVAFPAASQTQPPSVPATELVRETVAHELTAANAGGHYRYRIDEQTPQGSETRDMVETSKWLIGDLVLKNGQPLTPEQNRGEDERLRDLLTNPADLEKISKPGAQGRSARPPDD
jgi:hypothetical protein